MGTAAGYGVPMKIDREFTAKEMGFGSNQNPYPFYPGDEGIIYHHEIIGYSGVDNLPIWAVKLTLNADLNEDKPKALINLLASKNT